MMRDVVDVKAIRGLNGGLSDHMIVLCKLKLVGEWIKRHDVEPKGRRIRSEKMIGDEARCEYVGLIKEKMKWMLSKCGRCLRKL